MYVAHQKRLSAVPGEDRMPTSGTEAAIRGAEHVYHELRECSHRRTDWDGPGAGCEGYGKWTAKAA